MTRTLFAAVGLAATLLLSGGCGQQQQRQEGMVEREIAQEQAHSLRAVQLLAHDLRPGMTRVQVLTLLGAPAEYSGETWIYRDQQGELAPLRVHFENERFVRVEQGQRSGR